MTARSRALFLIALSSSILHADLTLKIRNRSGPSPVVEMTVYDKGDRTRSDVGPGYQVEDFSTGRSFRVDLAKREYYPFDGKNVVQRRVVDPNRKLFNESTYIDTGEQRQWFGYTAHRYLLNWKSRDELDGKPTGIVREGHEDMWFLDFTTPSLHQAIGSWSPGYLMVSMSGGIMKIPQVVTTQTGPRPHGLIVRQKSDYFESEIVSFSTAPLDESLFNPPPGFREVFRPSPPPLSFTDQLTLEWLTFRNWLNTLFGS